MVGMISMECKRSRLEQLMRIFLGNVEESTAGTAEVMGLGEWNVTSLLVEVVH